MALLKFNKGVAAGLDSKTISEGNVYITSDSQEMFVDVSATKRVKISDFITVNSSADLDSVDVVYDNVFYYIADTKTIVRYAGEDEGGNKLWEGINNTDQIITIGNQVAVNKTRIEELKTADNSINSRIDGLNAGNIATTDGITVTTAVGNYGVGETIDPNTSLQDLVLNMLCQDSEPTITQPSLSISGTAKYIEIGSSATTSVTATYSDGDYQYGYATLADGSTPDTAQTGNDGTEKAAGSKNDGSTGANLSYLDLNYGGTVLKSQTSGNSISYTVDSGVKTTKTSATVGAKCQHSVGYIPVSILKNKYGTKKIVANSNLTKSLTAFYWYIPMYHGFKYDDLIADPANITAAEVKGLETTIKDNTAYTGTKPTTKTATASWQQYFVAIPVSYNAELKGILDSNNLPLTIQKANNVALTFGSTTVDYEVFYVNLDAKYDTKKITLTW